MNYTIEISYSMSMDELGNEIDIILVTKLSEFISRNN
jgi:hypothetical protein